MKTPISFEQALQKVTKDGLALQHFSNELKRNRRIVAAAVNKNGLALQFADAKLQNDLQIVTAAVKQNGLALQFSKLNHDKTIVLLAVKQNGLALQFANPLLKNDPEVASAAIQENQRAIKFISIQLKDKGKYHCSNKGKTVAETIFPKQDDARLADTPENEENVPSIATQEVNNNKVSISSTTSSQSRESLVSSSNTPENVNPFSMKEKLKMLLGIAAIATGGLLLGGGFILPFDLSPALSLILSGCLLACGTVYTGYKLYQHRLSFFYCSQNTVDANQTQTKNSSL